MDQLTPGDPRSIGAYRLLARLGAGGMGQVYLARSDRGRTVAVKLVRRELAEQEEFRDRFRQEVHAARRVGGNWTAPVLDADTEAAVPWLATGYAAGPSLRSVIAQGPLPERSVRILGTGLAHALTDIHGAGLIHRDLKPSNILITLDGPRVIDFGIARALETASDGGLTRTGSVIGSPGFMAPEQVRATRVTEASDIFCLGSVLAYAATGQLPFGSPDSGQHAVMYRIAQEEPELTGVPDGLADLVRDCLRKSPSERPGLTEILERTRTEEGDEPWLPAALVARLGRHAVSLLEVEQPPERTPTQVVPAPGTPPGPDPGATPPRSSPTPPTPPTWPASPAFTPAPAAPGANFPTAPGSLPTPTPGSVPPPGTPAGFPPAPGGPQGPHPGMGSAASPTQSAPYLPQRPSYPHPRPPARSTRASQFSVIALGVAAVLIAVASGSWVYYALKDPDQGPPNPQPSPTLAGPSPEVSTTPAQSPQPSGDLPRQYIGTWRATFDSGDGTHTRLMKISQGATGEKTMVLTGTGPSYDCRWSATLQKAGPPLELGPTQLDSGDTGSCSPGQWSRLELTGTSTLIRELVGSGGTPLTYTRTE
ncbi:serine/threonine-protein kinase [Streptomyces albipurpureus]|uniref:serine/threonine-protein kinase n=1 Tax=Streptomyces albipurpureus TaxID=2897419 RepID=UPI002552A161|nr:serine/threonine-protein kinase [Streptomyces sp. CWNU-1]